MNELALFSGAGGGILGGQILGWRTVCAVECELYPAAILAQRQKEGHLPPFPIWWGDIREFDGRPWRGVVDVVSGGFPCQDISCAGKGKGIAGERSGLWAEMARIIREVGPSFVFVENSPMLARRGLERVLGDLAALGYDARWGVLGALHAGAPQKRLRIWILAHAVHVRRNYDQRQQRARENAAEGHSGIQLESDRHAGKHSKPQCMGHRLSEGQSKIVADAESRESGQQEAWNRRTSVVRGSEVGGDGTQAEADADAFGERLERQQQAGAEAGPTDGPGYGRNLTWWEAEPRLGRVAHGVAYRVDRLKAIGNGQVPAVAALAWRILSEEL